MLIHRRPNGLDLPYSSEITPQAVYEKRREFIKKIAMNATVGGALWELANREAFAQTPAIKLAAKRNPAYSALEKQTSFKDASTYNNYYEFGTDKSEPANNARTLKTRPWTVTIEGEVKKPMTIDIDALARWTLELFTPMRAPRTWISIWTW